MAVSNSSVWRICHASFSDSSLTPRTLRHLYTYRHDTKFMNDIAKPDTMLAKYFNLPMKM